MKNIGRNDPCPCGSGRKYKHCHLEHDRIYSLRGVPTSILELLKQGVKFNVPKSPEYLCLFGAGASYGSDDEGLLPPLGKDLFGELEKDPELKCWNSIPNSMKAHFHEKGFEEAMALLMEGEGQQGLQYRRDIELSLYFGRFRPLETNLYARLSDKIANQLTSGWKGAIVNINYERLLEESLLMKRVFPVIEGVQFLDLDFTTLPTHQMLEVCYPHGACHLFLGINPFQGEGGVIAKQGVKGGGFNHLLSPEHIKKVCDERYIPIICRYEVDKPATMAIEPINIQQMRYKELVGVAKFIAIVGMQCNYKGDPHIWEPLRQTTATLAYFEPSELSISVFQEWASACGKKEEEDYLIIQGTFSEKFNELCESLGLTSSQ